MLAKHHPGQFLILLLTSIAVVWIMNPDVVNTFLKIPILSYNIKRLIEFGILGLFGLCLVLLPKTRQTVLDTLTACPKWIQALIALFFILGLISATLAISPKYGFLEYGNYGLLVCFGLYLGSVLQDPHAKRTLLTAIFLSVLLYCVFQLIGLTQVYNAISSGQTIPNKILRLVTVYPQFMNQRFFGQVFLWIWPIFVYVTLLAWRKHKVLGVLAGLFTSYYFCLGLANNSRAVTYALVLTTLLVIIVHRKSAMTWFKAFTPIVVAGLMLNYVIFNVLLHSPQILGDDARLAAYSNGRFQLWKLAWQNFIAPHPFFGGGPLSYASIPNTAFAAHPHNFIVKIAAEFGLPAAIILLTITAFGLWAWVKKANHNNALAYKSALTVVLFGSAFDALVSGNLLMPGAQFLAPILIGLALAAHRPAPSDTPKSGHPLWRHIVLIAFALLCMGSIARGITPNIFHYRQTTLQAIQALKSCSVPCKIPPLIWFPQQVSPMMMWVR